MGCRLKTKEIVDSLIDSDGNFAYSDQEKANILNKLMRTEVICTFLTSQT